MEALRKKREEDASWVKNPTLEMGRPSMSGRDSSEEVVGAGGEVGGGGRPSGP